MSVVTLVPETQYVDPAVSRRKFDREIDEFRSHAEEFRNRGWFLLSSDFPNALVLLASQKTTPPAMVCGILFNYANYDADPPSIRLVNPFTCEPYKFDQLPTQLKRLVPEEEGPRVFQGDFQLQLRKEQRLMVAHRAKEIPFICIAGVREYHEHPAHSGDHWELYRSSGAGRLIRLVQIISKYGMEPIVGYHVQMIPHIEFQLETPPE